MFGGCKLLKGLDVSDWDTSNVGYMCYMFCNCKSLKDLDIS
jgi:surface protein